MVTRQSRLYEPPFARVPALIRPNTLDSYLLAQAVPPFTIALSVVLIALLLERLLVLLNLLAAEASPFSTLLRLLADLLPHYMGLALPAALCVSIFAVVRRMSDTNELDSLMSSGVSLLRVCRPFAVAGAALGVMSMLLYGYIQPHARYQFREGFYLASHAGWAPVLQPGVFATPSPTISLRADGVSHDGTDLTGVFIRDTGDGRERDIVAKRGHVRVNTAKAEAQIDLTDGSILTIPPKGEPSVTYFDHATRLISHAQQSQFRNRGDDERELTSGELSRELHRDARAARGLVDTVPPPSASQQQFASEDIPPQSLRAELNFRLARSLSIPFIPILAASLAVLGKRKRGSAGLAVAVVILVTYDHALQFGESLVATGRNSPLLVIWAPTLLFCGACTALILARADMIAPANLRAALQDVARMRLFRRRLSGEAR
ncbi:LptF/LptG family permease [Acetobacter sacchari]|uniref:LptF/LptG family permease n=1 Tax=Acetobacter sacchari TaxID=2661687 RepID=A0ABS3LQY8_9PROT|nr:LptF/LptG family permease [Acetobacter sacchari]